MNNTELKLTELGTDKFIDSGEIFYDIKERPRRYQVANATLGCIPDFMLCALDLFNTKGGDIIATSTTETGHIFNLHDTVEGLPEYFVRAYVAGGMDNSRVRYNGNISEIYYLSEDGKVANEIPLDKPRFCLLGLDDLTMPEPTGKFILEQTDIKPVMTHSGAYYHYADVCHLLSRFNEPIAGFTKVDKDKEKAKTIYNSLVKNQQTDAVEFMIWTYYPDQCPFELNDEDDWVNSETGEHVDTEGLYAAFLEYKKNQHGQE